MRSLALLLLTVCLASGCKNGNSTEQKINDLSDEVMVLHDEVMPLMDDLYRTRKQLEKVLAEDSTNTTLGPIIQNLSDGEDAMMDWMRNFNPGYEGDTDDETLKYFQDQKESILKVGIEMKAVLESGKQALPLE